MWETGSKVVIYLVIAAITLWDLAAVNSGHTEATISQTLLEGSKKHPIIAFALGVLMGHLFWANR